MSNRLLPSIPPLGVNALCAAGGIFIILLGIRVMNASDVALKVANTQLVTSNSADKLEELAKELEEQAKIIERKDRAYQDLQATYEAYLRNKKGGIELGKKIEAIDKLPQVENIDEIKSDIQETESDLLEITSE